MRRIYAFNGDADGLCALQQLRLSEDDGAGEFLTGPKRKTSLVQQVQVEPGEQALVTVLDLPLQLNAEAVDRLLAAGARVRYFDHHLAGRLPAHPGLDAHIDVSPHVCTSIIVNGYLGGAHPRWALVGAFGDNLGRAARSLAATIDIAGEDVALLERLGIALNHNSYAETEADMLFQPLDLCARLRAHADPVSFAREDPAFKVLWNSYDEDLRHACDVKVFAASDEAAFYLLPDSLWATRVIGTFANHLAREAPHRAHAVALKNKNGSVAVSVRAPLERPTGAAALCLMYPTGGGREAAAGINQLPIEELDRFAQRFMQHFRRRQ